VQTMPSPHAAQPTSESPQSLNFELITPFIDSTRRVLATMAGMDVAMGSPYLKSEATANWDVSGIISFSDGLVGSMAMTFRNSVALKLVAALTGAEMDSTSAEFTDAIGELANMIAGNAKQNLNMSVNISVPTVVTGAGHTIARIAGAPSVVIPCQSRAGDFAIEINIRLKRQI